MTLCHSDLGVFYVDVAYNVEDCGELKMLH